MSSHSSSLPSHSVDVLIRRRPFDLTGIRVLLVNPRTFPYDLRGEMHAPDTYKSERAMNFGLLVMASITSRAGADVAIFDQDAEVDSTNYDSLIDLIDRHSPHIVGVGIISVYQYVGACEVLRLSKDRGVVTAVGGQASGGFATRFLAAESPCDYLFRGDAEETFPQFLFDLMRNRPVTRMAGVAARGEAVPATSVVESLEASSDLQYELYPNWRSHFPLVEESRACPFKCSFCANESIANASYRGKEPGKLLQEVERAIRLWGGSQGAPVVLQCAIFGTHAAWTEEFLHQTQKSRLEPRFLAALRVDNHWERYVHLTRGIFDQVHFGFESGSVEILARMIKTGKPEHYLDRSAAAFKAFHSQGVHVGINVIFGFFGETYRSVGDTLRFILENRDYIDSVWGGPFVLYPDTPARKDLPHAAEKFGSRIVKTSSYCDHLDTYPVHASSAFAHEDAVSVGGLVMRLLNDEQTYYDHYKWYIGPRRDAPLSFYAKEDFYRVMFQGADTRQTTVNMSINEKTGDVFTRRD